MSRIFLAMNGKRINTLEDLRNNFNPEQMLSFYRSGRLQKWLEECGLNDELENIGSFEANYDDSTLLSMLMAVFELDDEQIAKVESAYEDSNENEKTLSDRLSEVHESASVILEDKNMESKFESTNSSATQVVQSAADLSASLEWNLGVLPNDFSSGKQNVDFEKIDPIKKSKCLIHDCDAEEPFSPFKVFFWDGTFWMIGGNYFGPKVVLKSSDCETWEIDEDSQDLAEFDFDDANFVQGDEHCFIIHGSYTQVDGCCLVYIAGKGWRKCKLNIHSVYSDTKDFGLRDIAEYQGKLYLLTHTKTSRGFFSTDHYNHTILVTDNNVTGFNKVPKKIDSEYDFDYHSFDNITIFKDKLFGFRDSDIGCSGADANHFDYTSLTEKYEFKKANFPGKITLPSGGGASSRYVRRYVAEDTLFVGTEEGLYCSRDGLSWDKCIFPKETSVSSGFFSVESVILGMSGKLYSIVTRDDEEIGGLFGGLTKKNVIVASSDGINWNEITEFWGVKQMAIGNNKILLLGEKQQFLVGKLN